MRWTSLAARQLTVARASNGPGAAAAHRLAFHSWRTLMPAEALIIWLVIGAVAGFLAGVVVKGYGFGLIGNIVIGIVGAVLGGALLPRLGIFPGSDLTGQIISATLGAIVLLILISFVRRIA